MEPLNVVKLLRKSHDMTSEEIALFIHGMSPEGIHARGIAGLFYLPYDFNMEIPKSQVIFHPNELGAGAFGQVITGTYDKKQVAIKMLNKDGNDIAKNFRSLLAELKVMSYLGKHPHLVRMIGAITENISDGEAYLIFEYFSNGNVRKFMRSHRDTFVDLLADQVFSKPVRSRKSTRSGGFYKPIRLDAILTTKDLVRWAYEIATAMEYLIAKNIYHGDIAAKNILLTDKLTTKLGNFGLAKQLNMESYSCYAQQDECPLPLKWMAIESLRDLEFTIQSDAWSFGVTMWELFTLGGTPYPEMDWNLESWRFLSGGKRLDKPRYASNSLYALMLKCWETEPEARPSFHQLSYSLYAELLKMSVP